VVMGHLALGERFGDHSDDFTADLESSVGHHTHQAHVPAAIDEANPLLAKVAAEFGSRGGERRVSAGARSAVHGDGVKLNGGHGCRRYRRGNVPWSTFLCNLESFTLQWRYEPPQILSVSGL